MASKIESITLLGSSSGRNAGDAALLSCIMSSVDKACGTPLRYEIPTLNPDFIRRNYSSRAIPIGILPWNLSLKLFGIPTYRSIHRTDLSLIFDATLFDRSLYNPFFNFLSSFRALLPSAKKSGKKLGCFTVTVGPVRTPGGKKMLKEVLDMMDFITVRDRESYDAVRDVGSSNPRLLITGDAAVNTEPSTPDQIDAIWKSLGLENTSEVLAINVNPYFDSWTGLDRKPITRKEFVDTYVEALNRISKELRVPLLFVSTQHLDETLTQEIMNGVQTTAPKALLSNTAYSHHDIKGVMSRAALLLAMRLHCIILTSSAYTPVSALSYLPKVDTYMKSLGLEQFTMSFADFSPEALYQHIRKSWEARTDIKRILNAEMPAMQQNALKAGLIVAAMRQGANLDRVIDELRNSNPQTLAKQASA